MHPDKQVTQRAVSMIGHKLGAIHAQMSGIEIQNARAINHLATAFAAQVGKRIECRNPEALQLRQQMIAVVVIKLVGTLQWKIAKIGI